MKAATNPVLNSRLVQKVNEGFGNYGERIVVDE